MWSLGPAADSGTGPSERPRISTTPSATAENWVWGLSMVPATVRFPKPSTERVTAVPGSTATDEDSTLCLRVSWGSHLRAKECLLASPSNAIMRPYV